LAQRNPTLLKQLQDSLEHVPFGANLIFYNAPVFRPDFQSEVITKGVSTKGTKGTKAQRGSDYCPTQLLRNCT